MIKLFTLSLPGLLLLSGCVLGPDFKRPESPQPGSYSSEIKGVSSPNSPKLVNSEALPEQWWKLFESKALSQLVEQGLANSPTLAAAEARLLSLGESLEADTGWVLFPHVDASATSARQKISGAAFGNAGDPRIFTVHNAAIDVSYTIDAFGGGQRYLEQGLAKVEQQAFQLEASRLTLITNIVTTAIAEASLREQIAATEMMVADEQNLLEMSEQQFDIGTIAKAAVLAQRTSLAQTRTQLPVLQKALASMRHQLAILIGAMPGEAQLPMIQMDDLVLPKEIPVTLPSSLTQRRPDVRLSETLLHQANAQIGIATANMYPKLALSASYATEATKLSNLFNAGSMVWGLGAGLTQPLFRAGELRARKRAALADFDQAAANYRQSVLTAFGDVADAMLGLEMDGRQLRLEIEADSLAAETLAIIREQHQQGAVSYLALLDAQSRYQQARINLIKARAAMFNDTAALIFALGGGWQQNSASEQPQTMEKQ